MSDAEALATLVPRILSTERFDFGNVIGRWGQLKAKARKAAGCLVVLLAVPILIIGVLFSNMKAAGVAVGVLVVVVVVAFKVIEHWLKSKFRKGPLNSNNDSDGRSPRSGLLDETERQERLNHAFAACGFPSVTELEPHYQTSRRWMTFCSIDISLVAVTFESQ